MVSKFRLFYSGLWIRNDFFRIRLRIRLLRKFRLRIRILFWIRQRWSPPVSYLSVSIQIFLKLKLFSEIFWEKKIFIHFNCAFDWELWILSEKFCFKFIEFIQGKGCPDPDPKCFTQDPTPDPYTQHWFYYACIRFRVLGFRVRLGCILLCVN